MFFCSMKLLDHDQIEDDRLIAGSIEHKMTQPNAHPNMEPHHYERRRKKRTVCDYPAAVKGIDTFGKKFSETGRAVNLSTCGIYFMASNSIQKNTKVSIRIALSTDMLVNDPSRLTTTGTVTRCEHQTDGKVGIAIQFKDYKFF